MASKKIFSSIKSDIPASIVVFFVALPLCLGIALASGAPLFSGLISGVVGGLIIGFLSGSNVGVSGPAAGLVAIVFSAIGTLGSYENFLLAVVLSGAFQMLFGILKAGIIGYYFPSSVIKGMLTGIGIIIIIKQIPHFFGYDADPEGDMAFEQFDHENSFSELINMVNFFKPGSALIGIIGMAIILFWDTILAKKAKIFKILQGPLIAVVAGIAFSEFTKNDPFWSISASHLVSVPVPDSFNSFLNQFTLPNFNIILHKDVWVIAFTVALVGSLETLLCLEATDNLDPEKNITPANRELLAQGAGNMISGMIGGLPITQVIVRSSANIQSGGKSKLSAILHGLFILLSVVLIPGVLNKIPLSVLAAILLIVGYKLTKPVLFVKIYKLGWKQFLPFIVTVLGLVFTDLLMGILLGLLVGIAVILIKSYQNSHSIKIENKSDRMNKIRMTLAEELTFFNKVSILKELDNLPENTELELDIRNTRYVDNDIIEILDDFTEKARYRNIKVKLHGNQGEIDSPVHFKEHFELFSEKV